MPEGQPLILEETDLYNTQKQIMGTLAREVFACGPEYGALADSATSIITECFHDLPLDPTTVDTFLKRMNIADITIPLTLNYPGRPAPLVEIKYTNGDIRTFVLSLIPRSA